MTAWFESLTLLQRVFAYAAIPATLVLLIQTVLLLFGLGGHDADTDVDTSGLDADTDFDGDLSMDADADFDISGMDADADTDFDTSGMDTDADTDFDTSGMDADTDVSAAHDELQDASIHDHGLRIFTIRGLVAFFTIFGWSGLTMSRAGIPALFCVPLAIAYGITAMVLMALILRAALHLQQDGTVRPQNALGVAGTVYLSIPPARSGRGKVSVLVQEHLSEYEAVTDEPIAIPTGAEIVVTSLSGKSTLVVRRK